MANRYTYQFNGSFKPKMNQIEGFVSIGTGGLLNVIPAYPIFPVGTGATGIAGQTGAPLAFMPGQATAGVPTGWQGGFSGTVGLYGAGVDAVARVATGLYAIKLSDDWTRLDSINVNYLTGPSGVYTGTIGTIGFSGSPNQSVDWNLVQHTVGLGNSVVTGGMTLPVFPGMNPKNTIWIQFTKQGPYELNNSDGFYIDLRLRDTLAGVQ